MKDDDKMDASRAATSSPQTSMTLSISREDAQRMLKASRALNNRLTVLQQEEEEAMEVSDNAKDETTAANKDKGKDEEAGQTDDEKVPKRVVSTSDHGSVSSSDETHKAANTRSGSLLKLVVKAASTCGDALIDSFLKRMQEAKASEQEMEICLLLFLDMDKSTKLMTAFGVLSKATGHNDEKPADDDKAPSVQEAPSTDSGSPSRDSVKLKTDSGEEGSTITESNESASSSDAKSAAAKASLCLEYEGAVTLFKSFLTSISTCIHHESSPTKRQTPSSDDKDEGEKQRKALKEDEQSSPNSSSSSTEDKDGAELPRSSPSFDSSMEAKESSASQEDKEDRTLSDQTRKEIQEIATFAADRLLEHVRKRKGDDSVTEVSFEDFGDWYNSGGFSIVPWLELLDLAKWNYAGRAAAANAGTPGEVASRQSGLAAIQEETQTDVAKEQTQLVVAGRKEPSPPPNFFMTADERERGPPDFANTTSRTLVSFDFTGAMSSTDGSKTNRSPFCINITEENLLMLRNLVHRTGLSDRTPSDVCKVLLGHSSKREVNGKMMPVMHRDEFGRCIRELVPPEASREFSRSEMEIFSSYFTNFFGCFENGAAGSKYVSVEELAVGFSFLCSGNKSSKLAAGFELMDENQCGHLTQEQLTRYLRSYLTMLVGISLLSSSPATMADMKKMLSSHRRDAMFAAVENGSKWTLGHFIKGLEKSTSAKSTKDSIAFEDFAQWYTDGGYNIAPWLELLDLSKLLCLLSESSANKSTSHRHHNGHERSVSWHRLGDQSLMLSPGRRRPEDFPAMPPVDVLFTFPLANQRSLVVLREDATYVRSVVEKLGLLQKTPEDVWSSLYDSVKSRPPPPPPQPWDRTHHSSGVGKAMDVDQLTFVSGMEGVILSKSRGRKRPAAGGKEISPGAKETLVNFFQSFDLDQVNRVGLNQLMGGLALLCGGKKSTKLAFAFGLFDGRDLGRKKANPGHMTHSLNGEELFLFLRSFLIVMFSCCRQSLDLSAEAVGRYISDTAHMVTEDVMKYQWLTRKCDRIDFDEFGEWYNEGGFETAPWLELLDLQKWVLVDDFESVENQRTTSSTAPLPAAASMPLHLRENNQPLGFTPQPHDYPCPPPPPEDAVDPSFFGDDEHMIMPMGSIDEMDFILMQQPSQDKENDGSYQANNMMLSPRRAPSARGGQSNPLKFHLVTNEEHGGYMLSVSQRRVRHFRHILMESGLCNIDAEVACKVIRSKATVAKTKNGTKPGKARGKKTNGAIEEETLMLNKGDFDSAVRSIIAGGKGKGSMSADTQRTLSDLLACMFSAFDRSQTGNVRAMEVACGFTVLCSGKKSDKLEYAFELLEKDGKMTRREMSHYLRSFLTALLSIASASCLETDENDDSISGMNGVRFDRSPAVIARAVDSGSTWAAGQAFKSGFKGKSERESICFDDFAEWYTSVGYSSIPWLELLDLRKWVLVDG